MDAPPPAGSTIHPAPRADILGDPSTPGSGATGKPADSEYGYVAGSVVTPCTREELLARCIRTLPDRVWTPADDRLVAPYDVAWIFDGVMEPARKKAHEHVQAMGFLLGLFSLVGLLAVLGGGVKALSSGPPPLLALYAVLFAQALVEERRLRAMTPALLAAQVAELRALPPARAGKPWFTWALAAAVGAVALAQVAAPGSSVAAAGLVKEAVRNGEWWRLFTAPLLHGGVLHLVMNGGALLALGPAVERLAHRAYLPLVFLAAALAGGAGSMLGYPHTTSVGASGGLLGIIGFLVVLAFRRRDLLPRDLGKDLLKDVGWIAVLGLVGFAFIDNGAHAGGLLGGVVLGLLLVPRGGATPHWDPSAAVRAAGWTSLAVIFAAAATAVLTILAAPVV